MLTVTFLLLIYKELQELSFCSSWRRKRFRYEVVGANLEISRISFNVGEHDWFIMTPKSALDGQKASHQRTFY